MRGNVERRPSVTTERCGRGGDASESSKSLIRIRCDYIVDWSVRNEGVKDASGRGWKGLLGLFRLSSFLSFFLLLIVFPLCLENRVCEKAELKGRSRMDFDRVAVRAGVNMRGTDDVGRVE